MSYNAKVAITITPPSPCNPAHFPSLADALTMEIHQLANRLNLLASVDVVFVGFPVGVAGTGKDKQQ